MSISRVLVYLTVGLGMCLPCFARGYKYIPVPHKYVLPSGEIVVARTLDEEKEVLKWDVKIENMLTVQQKAEQVMKMKDKEIEIYRSTLKRYEKLIAEQNNMITYLQQELNRQIELKNKYKYKKRYKITLLRASVFTAFCVGLGIGLLW